MSQTLTQKRFLRDHLKTEEKVPVDTYYEELADGLLCLLCILFVVGLVWAAYDGFLSLFSMFILLGIIGCIVVISLVHMADLFAGRHE